MPSIIRKTILSVFCFLFYLVGFSQSILSATELKAGFYKNFSEFVSNSPTVPFEEENMEFIEGEKLMVGDFKRKAFHFYGTAREISLGTFTLRDKKTKKNISTKSFWGYCDGTRIFINSYTHIPKQYFVEIIMIGRYCYFLQAGLTANVQPANKIGNPFNGYKDPEEYIININNGKIFNLDIALLKVILEKDKDLLEELKDDRSPGRRLLIYYIEKYNERHVDEIKFEH